MDGHELLIRHFAKWAEGRKRPFDAELLEEALDLRSSLDELDDTYWPAGSVEHLMLERWPSHGPIDPPPSDLVAQTLDAYVHFLRATGRMTSGSADPSSLAREARRAAPKMHAACADVGRHSQNKVLLGFGREIGIELDGAAGIEELNERLGRITEAWNRLPQEERVRRMPLTSNAPGVAAGRLTDSVNAVLAGATGSGWADDVDDDLPDVPIPPSDPSRSAQQARRSPFVQDCLRLGEWVGAGRAVTRTGVLRLAPAREAYVDLGLAGWMQGWSRIERSPFREEPMPEELERAAAEDFWWRSAADCLPLERLWFPCQVSGVLDVGTTKARAAGPELTTDEDWVVMGCALVVGLAERFSEWVPLVPLLYVLGQGILTGEPVPVSEVWEGWRSHEQNTDERVAQLMPDDADFYRARGQARLAMLFYLFDDTGIWTIDDDAITLTDFGRDVARIFFAALDAGDLTL